MQIASSHPVLQRCQWKPGDVVLVGRYPLASTQPVVHGWPAGSRTWWTVLRTNDSQTPLLMSYAKTCCDAIEVEVVEGGWRNRGLAR